MEDDLEAIEAFERWRAGESINLLNDDVLICECMCVSALDIRELFRDTREIDLKMLKEQLGVGQGCSSCIKSLDQWKGKIFKYQNRFLGI